MPHADADLSLVGPLTQPAAVKRWGRMPTLVEISQLTIVTISWAHMHDAGMLVGPWLYLYATASIAYMFYEVNNQYACLDVVVDTTIMYMFIWCTSNYVMTCLRLFIDHHRARLLRVKTHIYIFFAAPFVCVICTFAPIILCLYIISTTIFHKIATGNRASIPPATHTKGSTQSQRVGTTKPPRTYRPIQRYATNQYVELNRPTTHIVTLLTFTAGKPRTQLSRNDSHHVKRRNTHMAHRMWKSTTKVGYRHTAIALPELPNLLFVMSTRRQNSNKTHLHAMSQPQLPQEQTKIQKRGGITHETTTSNYATNPTGMYFEKQVNKFCTVHSLNNLLQNCEHPGVILNPLDILRFCNTVSARMQASNLMHDFHNTFDAMQGNFSTIAVNIYLRKQLTHENMIHMKLHTCPTYVPNATDMPAAWNIPSMRHARAALAWRHRSTINDIGVRIGSTQEQILTLLPPQTTEFLIHNEIYTSPRNAQEKYGHAICIRKHEGTWYMLDSEMNGPIPLIGTADWAMLYGSVYLVTPGPAPDNIVMNLSNIHPSCFPTITPPQNAMHKEKHTHTMEPDTESMMDTDPPLTIPTGPEQIAPHKAKTAPATAPTMAPRATRACKPKPRRGDTPKQQRNPSTSAANQETKPLNKRFKQATLTSLLKPTQAIHKPTNLPPTTKQQEIPNASPNPSISTRLLTMNCRGIRTNQDSIAITVADTKPDIMILTETKLISNMHGANKLIKETLSEYELHASSITKTTASRTAGHETGRGAAGVLVGIHKKYAATGCMRKIEIFPELAGHVVHTILQTPGSNPIHTVGVYMPTVDHTKRSKVYEYIQGVAAICRQENLLMLAGGDWNATQAQSDRATNVLTTVDKELKSFCKRANLSPIAGLNIGRPHTYHRFIPGAPPCSSRIDDVLTLNSSGCCWLGKVTESCEQEAGGSLDHLPLIHDINGMHLGSAPQLATTSAEASPRMILPIKKEHLQAMQSAIDARLSPTFNRNMRQLIIAATEAITQLEGNYTSTNIHALRVTLGDNPAYDVNAHAASLMQQLESALAIMFETCPCKKPTDPKHHMPRAISRTYRKLDNQSKLLKWLNRQVACHSDRWSDESKLTIEQNMPASADKPHEIITGLPPTKADIPEWQANNRSKLTHICARMGQMRLDKTKQRIQAARQAFQRKLATRPRIGNRAIFHTTETTHGGPAATALMDLNTGTVQAGATEILQIFSETLSKLMSPTVNTKTGKYLPHERETTPYPWESHDAPDTFKLDSPAMGCQTAAEPLHHFTERCTYDACLKHLGRSKQAGPDGIPNELLQWLPTDWHDAIHALFTLQWIMGKTPEAWKVSKTIMLFKKADPTNANNYRPIGLANTMYKLWTANVMAVAGTYAQATHIFSLNQEGFLPFRNTLRQINTLVSTINDAALTRQDLFILYVDFSSAFNMVDHDKLLCVMYDLGFPTDIIDTIKDIYTNAVTHVAHNTDTGPAIPITRGTIQGDVLSPFLFLIFMEPLLRWLQVGGRGYRYGSLTKQAGANDPNDQHNLSNATFADDTALMASRVSDMTVQCDKLSRYSAWSGLNVNHTKCAVTGILHNEASSGLNGDATCSARLKTLLNNKIYVGGQPVPYLAPNKPYKYLGVLITLTLDWLPQLTTAIASTTEAGIKLAQSMASPRQCLHIIMTCLKPALAYAFAAAPYLPTDIARLDRLICSIVRRCCRLPRSFPTASIHLPQASGGMGISSLMVDYAQVTAATLTRALNDTGRLGTITRALISLQHAQMGNLPTQQLPKAATAHFTALRQLALLDYAGIKITDGKLGPITPPKAGLWKLHHVHRGLTAANLAILGPGPDQGITAAMIYPLHQLGMRDITDMIAADGLHLISSRDLLNAKGPRLVKKRHMVALNRISLVLSRQTTSNWQGSPQKYPFHEALKIECRTLPTELTRAPTQPASDTLAGTKDIRHLLQQESIPTNNPPHQICIADRKRKLPSAAKRAANNDARYGRTQVHISAHTSPQNPEQFWTDTWAQLRRKCGKHEADQFANTHQFSTKGWTAMRDAIMSPASSVLHTDVVQHLYNTQEIVTHITGYQRFKGGGSIDQHQYTVAWQDTIISEAHLPHYQALGYALNGRTTPTTTEAVPMHLRSTHAQYVRVAWQPTVEPLSTLRDTIPAHTLDAMIMAYENQTPLRRTDAQLTEQPQHKDAHLNNLQRQGTWVNPSDVSYNAPLVNMNRKHVHLDPKECNPDYDISPPGRYVIQFGIRLPDSGLHTMNSDTAYIYNPQGRCIGSMAGTRLMLLQANYMHTIQTGAPKLHAIRATSFEEDVAKLVTRYRHGAPLPNRGTVEDKHQLTTPGHIVEALALFGATNERFASPLNFNPRLPTYCSLFPEDQLFGATLGAYDHIWTGSSYAHPAHNHADMHKAVRWAIASAEACQPLGIPSCTILTLPKTPGSPYSTHLSHPFVYQLDAIPKTRLRWWDPKFWAASGPPKQSTPTQDVLILAIANQAGYETYLAPSADAFASAWATARCDTPHGHALTDRFDLPPCQPWTTRTSLPPPRALHVLLRECHQRPAIACTMQTTIAPITTIGSFHAMYPCNRTLASEPDASAYTDGSCIKLPDGGCRTGAAVYTHARTGPGRVHHVLPGGKGYTNTINRAELSAIHVALSHSAIYPLNKDLTIYTDSLCSIYNIRKMMNTPGLLRESKHLDLLSNIVNALAIRAQTGAHTYIKKVRSHTDMCCTGNTICDAAAVMCCKGKHDPNAITERSDPDPYSHMAWPTVPAQATDNTRTAEAPAPPRHATNLSNSIKYAAQPTCGTGSADMGGIYASAWTSTAPTLHKPTSGRIWHDPSISWRQTMLCLKTRWGHLWSKKLAHRYRLPYNGTPARDPNCPLCSGLDGSSHILGGCSHPAMKAAYIARHDTAVKTLYSVLTKKSALGGFYSILDAGKATDLPPGVASKKFPPEMRPAHVSAETWGKLRPDIAIISGLPSSGTTSIADAISDKSHYKIILFEVGFCSDTKHESKRIEKHQQHKDLMNYLQNDGWDVTLQVVTLGHTGTVPQSLRDILASYTVPTTDIIKCYNQLHQQAVKTADTIISSRRALERHTPSQHG